MPSIELRRPVPLGPEHDRSRYLLRRGGDGRLAAPLRRAEPPQQHPRHNTAATWVIADQDDRVAAYATLSMTAIDHSAAPVRLRKAAPDPVPALLVGRLAVDEAFAGLGVGTALVRHLLATAVEVNLSAACKAVVVTALHEQARSWWLKLGFAPFEDAGLELYLLTADIQKTLG